MRVQKSYIHASSAQMTAPGLFGGFFFRGLKKLKGGDSWIHSTAQRKEHSKTEFGKKNSEKKFGESKTFYQSKFSRATGVTFATVTKFHNFEILGHTLWFFWSFCSKTDLVTFWSQMSQIQMWLVQTCFCFCFDRLFWLLLLETAVYNPCFRWWWLLLLSLLEK